MNEVDEHLARLARATNSVRPSAAFIERVMAAVGAEGDAVGWWSELPRAARRVVPALAVAAVLAVAWAFRSTHEVDEAFATSFGSVEIEW